MTPAWLPCTLALNGEWKDIVATLYKVFTTDFKNARPTFLSLPVFWDNRMPDGQYEEGFWHLITEGDVNERLYDPRRSERLPWCRPSIVNCHHDCVMTWNYLEGNGRIRSYVWLYGFDYVVVLERQRRRFGEIAFLKTAFYVNGDSTRKRLRKKYDQKVI